MKSIYRAISAPNRERPDLHTPTPQRTGDRAQASGVRG